MAARSEPQLHLGRKERLRDLVGRHHRAPGSAAGESRRRAPPEPFAQPRPQAVGADQRTAVLLARGRT
jgi:hypothetical protein